MAELAANIWADGPSTSPYQPEKRKIRDWGAWVESIINGFISGSGWIYSSLASLNADLAKAAGVMAWVIGDATAANNGVYRKIGASGSGSWVRASDLPFSFIIASNTGSGTANAIIATSSIPVSGSALVVLPIAATNTASPVTVSFNGTSTKTIKTASGNDVPAGALVSGNVTFGYVSGSTFRLLTDIASAAIQAAAEAARVAAEAARDAALGAVPNAFPPTIAALKALSTGTVTSAFLKLAGREGQFVWKTGDYSAQVAADTLEAVYIASSTVASTSGAWVRVLRGQEVYASWFGFVSDSANPINASRTLTSGYSAPYPIDATGPFQKAFDFCADNGFVFVVDQKYYITQYLMMKDYARIRFVGSGELVCAVGDPVIGGFIVTRYTSSAASLPTTGLEVWDLRLDCNAQAAVNGIAVAQFTGGRFYGSSRVKNSLHDVTLKGGRAWGLEGGTCFDVHIESIYLENCSIGISSQGLPTTYTATHISIGKVTMKDVGMPFDLHCTTSGSETMTMARMSTTIGVAVLYNCGRPQWLNSVDRFKGGIVCSDRGSGLHIGLLRILNETSYGLVGAICKGTMFGVVIDNCEAYGTFNRLVDFNYLDFITGASAANHPNWVNANIVFRGPSVDRVFDTGAGGATVGALDLKVTIDPAVITNPLCASNAITYNQAFMTLTDLVTGIQYPKMSLKQIGGWGNTFPLLTPAQKVTRTRQDMASATPRTMLTVAVPNNGRVVLAVRVISMGVGSGTTGMAKIEDFHVAICRDGGGGFTSAVSSAIGGAQALDGYTTVTQAVTVADAGSGYANINVTVTNNLTLTLATTVIAELIGATAGASIVPSAPDTY